MKKEVLKHISAGHYRKIQKYLDGVAKDMDGEDIHQLRVEYKKLRAFFRMLSSGPRANEEIKVSKKLKQLYSVCGTIRDLQLQQQRVQEIAQKERRGVKAYLDLLQSEIDKSEPELQDVLSKKPVQESRKRTNASLPEKFLPDDFKNFAKKKWNSIHSVLASAYFSDDGIHSVRKYLKDLFYNLKVYEGVEYEILAVSVWKGKGEQFFTSFLDELGEFQDRCISIGLLKAYWIKRFAPSTRNYLEELKIRWLKEKIKMKKAIVKKLKTDIYN